MEKKKGQLAIFIIVGVILLLIFGIIFFSINKIKQKPLEEVDLTNVDEIQLKNFISSCVDNVASEGVNTLGFRDNALEQYMNYNIQRCTNNFEDFEKQGFKVNISTINSTVTISENAVAAYVNYPVEITLKDFNFKSYIFNFILNKKDSYKLPVENNRIKNTITITSPDGRMELIIPKNTIVNKDEIKISMRNNDYDKDKNAVMIPFIYEFTEGVIFSPAATLIYSYDEKILPKLTDENSLKISYYDKSKRKMVQLSSVVDPVHNKITSSVEHFTDVTVTTDCSCLNKEQAEKELELEKPKTIFDLSDEECVQEREEQEEEEEQEAECSPDASECNDFLPCEEGEPISKCEDGKCVYGCGIYECMNNEECDEDKICEEFTKACIEITCDKNEDCSSYENYICDTENNKCVRVICENNEECSPYGAYICDTENNKCIEATCEDNDYCIELFGEDYICIDNGCVVEEEQEEEQEEEETEEEEMPITTCEEAQITKTENEDGSVNYRFRMKPSDCGEDGVCYLAFMVQDDSKIIGFSPEESPEETEETEEPEEGTGEEG